MNKIKIMTKQVISYSFGRQVRLLALAVLFLAPFWAWGQTDYSGVYYIGSVGYNSSTPAINYYLCPTEGWCYYAPDDDFTKKLLILIIITSSKPALENIYFPMAKFARLMSIVCVYTLKQFLVISMTKHCLP